MEQEKTYPIKKFFTVSPDDVFAFQQWLEAQAEQGLFLKRIEGSLAFFAQEPPPTICYRLIAFGKGENGAPCEERLNALRGQGFSYVDLWRSHYYIVMGEAGAQLEEVFAKENLRLMLKALRKRLALRVWLMCGILCLTLLRFPSAFPFRFIERFDEIDPFGLFTSSVCLSLFLLNSILLVNSFVCYLLPVKRAYRLSSAPTPVLSATKRARFFAFGIIFLFFLLCGAIPYDISASPRWARPLAGFEEVPFVSIAEIEPQLDPSSYQPAAGDTASYQKSMYCSAEYEIRQSCFLPPLEGVSEPGYTPYLTLIYYKIRPLFPAAALYQRLIKPYQDRSGYLRLEDVFAPGTDSAAVYVDTENRSAGRAPLQLLFLRKGSWILEARYFGRADLAQSVQTFADRMLPEA